MGTETNHEKGLTMNKMYCIIDNHVNNGFIAFCSTLEKAREMCSEYCEDVYDDVPENVENVWIDDYELDTWAWLA